MRVLFLDDDTFRHSHFLEWCSEVDVVPTMVKTADKCAEELEKGPWDIVFLDHDLAADHYGAMGEKEGDGTALARWMSKDTKRIPKEVVIHSYNPDGAARMQAILHEATKSSCFTNEQWRIYYQPFGPSLKPFLKKVRP